MKEIQASIRLYTHNVRYARNPPFENEPAWDKRKAHVVNSILAHAPSVVCLQEVLWGQLQDIMAELGPRWDYAGVGRDDGKTKGEFTLILYRKSEWHVSWAPFWLSPTPKKPSKGWDAALNRIVIQAHFRSVANRDLKFIVYSTHFDHQGETARRESARLILRLMQDQAGPQILCGDLNSKPDEKPYSILTANLQDSEACARKFGHKHTYTSFGDEPHTRIDYILHTPGISVDLYAVPHSNYGFYFSDHRPVVADLTLSPRPPLESSP